MNRVLYEASFQFHPFLLIPFIIMIYIIMKSFILKQKNKLNDNKYHNNYKLNKRSRMIGVAFFAMASLEVLLGQIYMYNKIVKAYKQGKYQIVEGYVENFYPMPYGGGKAESFDINGVSFSYTNFTIEPGYHNAKSHGGVITGNGQHLKIGYVFFNSAEGNKIVYIEELD